MKAQIIEQEGKFYKECGIVMLETEKDKLNYAPIFIENEEAFHKYSSKYNFYDARAYHLYITSDDKTKADDILLVGGSKIMQATDHIKADSTKKIIASTDPSLGLPSPSDKFIQAYIEFYNKGEKIEKVLVEYEKTKFIIDKSLRDDVKNGFNWQPKLKDNNIIIKKIKDSWSREEVGQLLIGMHINLYGADGYALEQVEQWIKENL